MKQTHNDIDAHQLNIISPMLLNKNYFARAEEKAKKI